MPKKMMTLLLALALALTTIVTPVSALELGGTAVDQDSEYEILPGNDPAESAESLEESAAVVYAVTESAAGDLTLNSIGEEGYITMSSSEDLIALIKHYEGFQPTPKWDYSQYSIGYGSRCPDDVLTNYLKLKSEGRESEFVFTEEEADVLLRDLVSQFDDVINNFAQKNDIQFLQHQFDALVAFSYALGTKWMSGNYRLTRWLKNPTTEQELVEAFGNWCRVSGEVWSSTAMRRMIEVDMFLYGRYLFDKNDTTYVVLVYNGGTYKDGSSAQVELSDGYTDMPGFFLRGEPYGELLEPTVDGYDFVGWNLEKSTSKEGQWLTEEDIAVEQEVVYGRWVPAGSAPTTPELPFEDVSEENWFYESVCYVYQNDYMSGTDTTIFDPEGTVNRAMAVTVLYRLAGRPAADLSSPFTDVELGRYYTQAVAWAYANGIVKGISETEFNPNGEVTREQLAAFFYRFCQYLMMEDSELAQSGDLTQYTDGNQVSKFAKTAMSWAVGSGLIKGSSGATLNPGGSARRCEFATMLARFVQNILPQ